jgi:hypothetical protein
MGTHGTYACHANVSVLGWEKVPIEDFGFPSIQAFKFCSARLFVGVLRIRLACVYDFIALVRLGSHPSRDHFPIAVNDPVVLYVLTLDSDIIPFVLLSSIPSELFSGFSIQAILGYIDDSGIQMQHAE